MVKIEDIDKGWKNITKEIHKIEHAHVKIGVLSTAGAYPDGVNLADIATFNEFGTSRIPARPFMGQTYDRNRGEVSIRLERGFTELTKAKMTAEGILKTMGVWYKGQIQRQFTEGDFAPNAPSTIARKSPGGRPLIDTGRLRQSINFEVEGL